MADFMTAMKAAREGKRVRLRHDQATWCTWCNGFLKNQGGVCITISDLVLDGDWEIEVPPLKRYTFAEAVTLMEQGRRMRPLCVGHDDVRHTFEIRRHRSANRFFVVGSTTEMGMSLPEIKSEWEEEN